MVGKAQAVHWEAESRVPFQEPWPCPPPTPQPLRQRLWLLAEQGLSALALAASLALPPRTVYRLLALFRQARGPTPPRYDRCGRPPDAAFAACRAQVLAWRRDHPAWGAGRLLAQLRQADPGQPLPSVRTLRRWLAEDAPAPRPPRRQATAAPRATRPHQIWQMDASEQKSLRSGQKVSWLRLVDEASGAVLFSRVFAQASWAEVGAAAVQAALRQAFAVWGRPDGLRVDNGTPWVCSKSDLPSALELWLAGLGVALPRNRKRCPQANAKVERGQRTGADWAEPGQCDTPEQLQRRLDEEDRVQRQVYLFDGRHTRLQAFPDLGWGGRPYAPGPPWEDVCWDLSAAWECLAGCEVSRKVDGDGDVWLYDHQHYVGAAYRGQTVTARWCAATREWVFACQGQEVRRCPAKYLTAEGICRLQVGRRPGRSAGQTQKRRALRGAAGRPGPGALPGEERPGPAGGG